MHQSTKNTTLANNLFKNKQKTFETRKKNTLHPPISMLIQPSERKKTSKGKPVQTKENWHSVLKRISHCDILWLIFGFMIKVLLSLVPPRHVGGPQGYKKFMRSFAKCWKRKKVSKSGKLTWWRVRGGALPNVIFAKSSDQCFGPNFRS